MMNNLKYITIVIPLRIDSEERRANLNVVLDYLCNFIGITVMVLEADTAPHYVPDAQCPILKYQFIEDHDPVFYRTRYLNRMLQQVNTPVAGIWDSDVIVHIEQVAESVRYCLSGVTLCYPYDGRFYAVSDHLSRLYRTTKNLDILNQNESQHWLMHGRYSVGGAFTVNVEKYLAAGGENENFYGWGPEDTERRERICNLGLKVSRVQGSLFHLHHPRGVNSNFANRERAIVNRREYMKICRMSREELEKYISTWSWRQQTIDRRNVRGFRLRMF